MSTYIFSSSSAGNLFSHRVSSALLFLARCCLWNMFSQNGNFNLTIFPPITNNISRRHPADGEEQQQTSRLERLNSKTTVLSWLHDDTHLQFSRKSPSSFFIKQWISFELAYQNFWSIQTNHDFLWLSGYFYNMILTLLFFIKTSKLTSSK